MSKQTKRDFLFLATGLAGSIGAGAIAWPFIGQLRPDDMTLAASAVEIDVSAIAEGMSIIVKWQGKPVVIRNRSAKEVKQSQATPLDALKDQNARNDNLDKDALATDFNRNAGTGRQNWIIMVNLCTHLGCVTLGESGSYGGWFCPCHGSNYDTAGRIRNGPANQNLVIPKYEFISDTIVRIG